MKKLFELSKAFYWFLLLFCRLDKTIRIIKYFISWWLHLATKRLLGSTLINQALKCYVQKKKHKSRLKVKFFFWPPYLFLFLMNYGYLLCWIINCFKLLYTLTGWLSRCLCVSMVLTALVLMYAWYAYTAVDKKVSVNKTNVRKVWA